MAGPGEMSTRDVAEALCIPPRRVRHLALRLGIRPLRYGPHGAYVWDAAEWQPVIDRERARAISTAEVARRMHVTERRVWQLAQVAGLRPMYRDGRRAMWPRYAARRLGRYRSRRVRAASRKWNQKCVMTLQRLKGCSDFMMMQGYDVAARYMSKRRVGRIKPRPPCLETDNGGSDVDSGAPARP